MRLAGPTVEMPLPAERVDMNATVRMAIFFALLMFPHSGMLKSRGTVTPGRDTDRDEAGESAWRISLERQETGSRPFCLVSGECIEAG